MDHVTNDVETFLVVGGETDAALQSFLSEEISPDIVGLNATDTVKITVVPVLLDGVKVVPAVPEPEPEPQIKQPEPEEFILTDTESFEPSEEESPTSVMPEEVHLVDIKPPFTIVPSPEDSSLLAKQEVSSMKPNIEQKQILHQEHILAKESVKVVPETATALPPGDEPPSDNSAPPQQPQGAKPKRKRFARIFSSLFCCLGRVDDGASEQQSERE